MRLVEFLILLLTAHAETLRRLAALLGEERFLHILEDAGDLPSPDVETQAKPTSFDRPCPMASASSAYQELEGAVREMHLPEPLEFHLWAYPHYRAFIESPIDLNSRIPGSSSDAGLALVEEAVAQAAAWVQRLPLPPQIGHQVERAAQVPWLRFRTTVLNRIGKRPMASV